MNPSDYYTKMDITSNKKKGRELLQSINDEVEPYFKSKLMALPSEILMTQSQYDDLVALSGDDNLFHQKDRLFQTKYNIMEVTVLGRDKATFTEVMDMSAKEFNKWEKQNG